MVTPARGGASGDARVQTGAVGGDQVEALAADADKGDRGRVQVLAQPRADRLQQLALVSRRLADAQDRDQLVGERIGHRIHARAGARRRAGGPRGRATSAPTPVALAWVEMTSRACAPGMDNAFASSQRARTIGGAAAITRPIRCSCDSAAAGRSRPRSISARSSHARMARCGSRAAAREGERLRQIALRRVQIAGGKVHQRADVGDGGLAHARRRRPVQPTRA